MENSSANGSEKNWDHKKVLGAEFYQQKTLDVARALLGNVLVVGKTAVRIVEVEAYCGSGGVFDPASHSSRGMTPRSAPMFEAGGIAYVYFIYGMYQMLNFVTDQEGVAGAVLIRAGEPIEGHALMKKRRNGLAQKHWTSGPGKLAQALGIKPHHNRASLLGPEIQVFQGERPDAIFVSPRVGISEGIELPWRFFIPSNYVSNVKENQLAKPLRLGGR